MNPLRPLVLIAGLLSCMLPATAFAQSSIGTAAGCRQTFKGNKGTIAQCSACVKTGRFTKKLKNKGAWTCEGSAGRGGGDGADMRPSKRAETEAPVKAPAKLSSHFTAFVKIPAGTFTIGTKLTRSSRSDNEYQSKVTITRPFEMKATEVTHGEWQIIMGTPSTMYQKKCGHDCPVTHVTFRDAIEYLNAISTRAKLEPCYEITDDAVVWNKGLDCAGYRLPTEAEWEYAARGGTTTPIYGEPDAIAWYGDNSRTSKVDSGMMGFQPVAAKAANKFGLYDMIGNVNEWCWDLYEWGAFENASTDPIIGGLEAKGNEQRMVRGHNYGTPVSSLRAGYRDYRDYPRSSSEYTGFRPVRTIHTTK